MAENFEDVVKKLGKTIKKPTESKAQAVIAVQMVDSKGKVIKEEKGAAVAEAQREEEKREKKTNTLLDGIRKSLSGKKELPARDPKTGRFMAGGAGGGFLKSILPGLLPAGMIGLLGGASLLGKLGIGGIALAGIWSAVAAIGDGLEGMEWAKSMGMEKESGFIARFFAGDIKGGLMNAFVQSMKGAAMGATLGMAGGPVGMIVGALLGAALFGIAGFFGAEALAKMIDPLVQDARKLFGLAINVTPEELEDAKKVAEETGKLKDDAIATVKGFVEQIEEAQAATEPDQELIDKLILLKAVAMKASLEAHKNHEKAATKALELDRAAERNAVIAAEEAVTANNIELMNLNDQRRKLQSRVVQYGEDTLEGQVAAAELAAIRVKLRNTRADGKKLRDDEEKAEAVLLEEDRRLIKKAADEGGTAPWRARFNVWTADTWTSIKDGWMELKRFIPTWFADNIFDPGSGPAEAQGHSGTPMKIFGFALPSMEEVTTKITEKWKKFTTGALKWFADNIFDGGPPMKIFGKALPSMEEVTTKITEKWSNFTTGAVTWFKDNVFDAGGDGKPMKILGVAIPTMGEISTEILGNKTLKESMQDKLDKIMPEWIKDPEKWARENFKKLEKWAKNLLPELPNIGDIIPDISFEFPNPMKMIGDAIKEKFGAEQFEKEWPGFTAGPARWKSWVMGMVFGAIMDIFPTSETAMDDLTGWGAGGKHDARVAGGRFSKDRPMLVGELGPELILPDQGGHVFNAQRTQQMLQAGIQRGMGGGAGGGITSINTGGNVVSSPTTNYVNNGIAARRPILMTAPTVLA